MFKSGAFVADQFDGLQESQIQPNGVDLTLDAVFEQTAAGRIERGDKTVGRRRQLDPTEAPWTDDDSAGAYTLGAGGYIVRYGERIEIPADHIGFLYPRSSLLRNSCMLDTAVWDAGYEGRGEGLLEVYHELTIEEGARIAQLVLAEAEHVGEYDGSYQRENL